ncbi:MAG TPA: ATP-binding protein, partial [Acidimicrobiia bacterium]|nr:ATP-binding protein [Acidimicrobiia bacterium]
FAPFQRLGDTAAGSGVGLGLAVARGFVQAMRGTVEIEDTAGGGTTVVISLPAGDRYPFQSPARRRAMSSWAAGGQVQ